MKPESPFLNLGQSAHCKKLLQGFPGILAVLYVNNSFFPFFIQSASGTMLRFLQTVDRNILAGLGALCPILLIVNLIGQGFQLCKVMFRFVRILLQIILQCDFYDFVMKAINDIGAVFVYRIVTFAIILHLCYLRFVFCGKQIGGGGPLTLCSGSLK